MYNFRLRTTTVWFSIWLNWLQVVLLSCFDSVNHIVRITCLSLSTLQYHFVSFHNFFFKQRQVQTRDLLRKRLADCWFAVRLTSAFNHRGTFFLTSSKASDRDIHFVRWPNVVLQQTLVKCKIKPHQSNGNQAVCRFTYRAQFILTGVFRTLLFVFSCEHWLLGNGIVRCRGSSLSRAMAVRILKDKHFKRNSLGTVKYTIQ